MTESAGNLSALGKSVADAVGRLVAQRSCHPLATYRLQFARGTLTFRDAAAVAPYLDELGVSHLYASPCLKTRSGSTHGYTVVDFGQLDPALGSGGGLSRPGRGPARPRPGPDPRRRLQPHERDPAGEPLVERRSGERPGLALCGLFRRRLAARQGGVAGQGPAADAGGAVRASPRSGRTAVGTSGRGLLHPLRPDAAAPGAADLPGRPGPSARRAEGDPAGRVRGGAGIGKHPHGPGALARVHRHRPRPHGRAAAGEGGRQGPAPPPAAAARRPSPNSSPATCRSSTARRDDPHSYDRLDKLLDAQVYRLAHWKAAGDEINYRRFFDVNDLAAVCMEDPQVFEESHRLVFDLLVHGDVDALRIDHIDGLYDPMEYLRRLQWGYVRALGRAAVPAASALSRARAAAAPRKAPPTAPRTRCRRREGPLGQSAAVEPDLEPAFLQAASAAGRRFLARRPPSAKATRDRPDRRATRPGEQAPAECLAGARVPLCVVVEKILGPEEPLPEHWPVAGTTGYDFLNHVNGLFVDGAGLTELVKVYNRFIDQRLDFREVAYQSKLLILRATMASEVHLLAHRLNRISRRHRRSRDFTLNALRAALREILACFPVYRTYIHEGHVSERDRQFVCRAVAQAKRRNPTVNAAVFDFIRDVLLLAASAAAGRGRPAGAGAVRGPLPADHQSRDGQGDRGHRLLPLLSAGCRSTRWGATRPAAPPRWKNSTARTWPARPAGPAPCWPPAPTTPSGAKTRGRGSTSFPRSRTAGGRP